MRSQKTVISHQKLVNRHVGAARPPTGAASFARVLFAIVTWIQRPFAAASKLPNHDSQVTPGAYPKSQILRDPSLICLVSSHLPASRVRARVLYDMRKTRRSLALTPAAAHPVPRGSERAPSGPIHFRRSWTGRESGAPFETRRLLTMTHQPLLSMPLRSGS